MRRLFLFFTLCLFAGLFSVSAQSTAEEIETLLGTGAVTYAQAARFVLEASDAMVTSSHEEAFRYAAERNWLPKNAAVDDAARLDGISLLLMRSFDLKGGLFYSIFKNAHYAYRELTYRNVIQGRANPDMNVSGERLLFLTGRILSQLDDVATIEAERRRGISEEDVRVVEEEVTVETQARREALAAEINEMLEEQHIANTSAEVTDEGIVITLSNIQFLADSSELPENEKFKLREIAIILRTIPNEKIQVAGHTALAGTAEARLRVSLERAQAVASYLITLGVRADMVSAVGYGAEFPIADNSTEAGMAINRRVEIIILEN